MKLLKLLGISFKKKEKKVEEFPKPKPASDKAKISWSIPLTFTSDWDLPPSLR